MGANSTVAARRRGVGLGVEAAHLGFDPALDFAHQVVGRAARRRDRRADRHVDDPGRSTKDLRGQQRAEVTAIGSTGVPVVDREPRAAGLVYALAAARRARALGNMMIQLPCAMKRTPCSATFAHASVRLLRSIWTMSRRAIAQRRTGSSAARA
jgi:hypothetical protein